MYNAWEVEKSNPADSDAEDRASLVDPHQVLHRRYFAEAIEPAGRYGIPFNRVIAHLYNAESRARRGGTGAQVVWLADVVQAAACIDGCSRAWNDLIEQHEPYLVHAVEARLNRPAAILFVRSLLIDLRHATIGTWPAESSGHDVLTLQRYTGRQSLRKWLAQRLVARFSRVYPWTARRPVLRLVAQGHEDRSGERVEMKPVAANGHETAHPGAHRRIALQGPVSSAIGMDDDGRGDRSLSLGAIDCAQLAD